MLPKYIFMDTDFRILKYIKIIFTSNVCLMLSKGQHSKNLSENLDSKERVKDGEDSVK